MYLRRSVALVLGSLNLLGVGCSSRSDSGASPIDAGAANGGMTGSVSAGNGGSPPASFGGSSAGGPDIVPQPEPQGGASSGPQPMTDVTVVITADNAYGFGYGTGDQIVNYFGGVENTSSAAIFSCPVGNGPETYTVPAAQANSGDFLYIIGYADKTTTQGVIAKFFREGAPAVYTGTGTWQGCATGMDFDPGSGGPTLDVINQQIAACNAGNTDLATTSGGWVGPDASPRGRVIFGEDNSTDRVRPSVGNEFKIACDIDPAAHWMWYDWEADRTTGSPFMWPGGTANVTKDFVIFRLTAESIPDPPPK